MKPGGTGGFSRRIIEVIILFFKKTDVQKNIIDNCYMTPPNERTYVRRRPYVYELILKVAFVLSSANDWF